MIAPLTEDEEACWIKWVTGKHARRMLGEKVAVASGGGPGSIFQTPVTYEGLRRLENKKWLNDDIINVYMELLRQRSERAEDNVVLNCHFFSSWFYRTLVPAAANLANTFPKDNKSSKVKTGFFYLKATGFTKNIDVFSKDMLFVPISLPQHWTLVVVNFLDRRIENFDPRGGKGIEALTMVHQWLKYEHVTKLKAPWDDEGWTFHSWDPKSAGVPEQTDGYNCGVYLCKTAEYYGRGALMDFAKRHMELFRKRMLSEIVNRTLYVAEDHEVVVLSDSDSDANNDNDVEMQDALAGTQTPPVDEPMPQGDAPVRSASAETVAPAGAQEEGALLLLQEQVDLANGYNEVIRKRDSSLLDQWRAALLAAVEALEVGDTRQSVVEALRALNEDVRKAYDNNLAIAFPPEGSRARRGVEKQLVYAKKQLASKKNSEK